jgi:hypothetical protein
MQQGYKDFVTGQTKVFNDFINDYDEHLNVIAQALVDYSTQLIMPAKFVPRPSKEVQILNNLHGR